MEIRPYNEIMKTSLFLMKVSRSPQNEAKVPFKVDLPLKLRNYVSGKNKRVLEKGCLHEFSLVTNCLEKNNYENKFCNQEVNNFQTCFKKYLERVDFNKKAAMEGNLIPGTRNLQYRQINIMLKKFPQP